MEAWDNEKKERNGKGKGMNFFCLRKMESGERVDTWRNPGAGESFLTWCLEEIWFTEISIDETVTLFVPKKPPLPGFGFFWVKKKILSSIFKPNFLNPIYCPLAKITFLRRARGCCWLGRKRRGIPHGVWITHAFDYHRSDSYKLRFGIGGIESSDEKCGPRVFCLSNRYFHASCVCGRFEERRSGSCDRLCHILPLDHTAFVLLLGRCNKSGDASINSSDTLRGSLYELVSRYFHQSWWSMCYHAKELF